MKDTELFELIEKEKKRQVEVLEMIPSENYVSSSVREALGSVLTNKYSEGYPHKRYYGGNDVIDDIETLAQKRAQELFDVPYANVQPYSGSPANLAVYLATINPGETFMGQALTAGGHLTHGASVSASAIFFNSVQYGVHRDLPELFDYDEILKIAQEVKPKLIWVGGTAHPLKYNYQKFAQIADNVGAYLVADIAHVAGLIVGGVHPSPVEDVHIITTTTHKTLRGPRGAMIMVTKKGLEKDPLLPQKIDKAVFPGLQGGPHDQQTAAIAVALKEAVSSEFKDYTAQILKNSRALSESLKEKGLTLVGNQSENHLTLLDLTPIFGPGGGIFAQTALDFCNITLNKNTIPDEPYSPFYPSGIRLGTPALTTRGLKETEMEKIADWIKQILDIIRDNHLPTEKEERINYLKEFKQNILKNQKLISLKEDIRKFAQLFPVP